jgi:hypothetical protein
MKKALLKKLMNAVIMLLVVINIAPVNAFAATKNPYSFIYDDAATGRTMYRFYEYSSSEDAYEPVREFYSRGTSLYAKSGKLVTANSYSSGSLYNGFDKGANFYFITRDGALSRISRANVTEVVIPSGVKNLEYNTDDIAIYVRTNSGLLSISNLKPAEEVDPGDDPVPQPPLKAQNRVEISSNSANELVYVAYKNGKSFVRVVTSKDGKKVLNETARVRLSDVLSGAKFLGFDTSYNVYLCENNGTLYRFKYGSWYSPEKLQLAGTYKKFESDSNGFISKVVTTTGSYSISQLTTSAKWRSSSTYVVKKSGYQTLYVKGSTKSHTLSLKNKQLSYNGKVIAKGVSKYGFTSNKKIVYIKNKIAYIATLKKPTTAVKLSTKASKLSLNGKNLVTKVILSSGKKIAAK